MDFRKLRIAQIMDQLNQVAGSRDLMDCSPSIRTLIAEEVPLLVELLDERADRTGYRL
ncbi:MAG: hypothetical protein WD766_06840 [Gemmatimonadota bacterium]